MTRREQKTPVKKFAVFFRSYGIALGVIIGAIPVVTRAGGLLPGYQAVRDTLTFATSLLSLLAIAFLFGFRRHIGEAVFPVRPGSSISREQQKRRTKFGTATPVALALIAIFGLVIYLVSLNLSIAEVAGASGAKITKESMEQILSGTSFVAIPFLSFICGSYTMMFIGAATAFVWGGLIEYTQGELGITDAQLMAKPYVLMSRHDFKVIDDTALPDSAPFFYFEWDPQSPEPAAHVTGPLCERHKRVLKYEGKRGVAEHAWVCVNPDKKNDRHEFTLSHDSVALQHLARAKADALLQERLGHA
jgi:hypothetical protein